MTNIFGKRLEHNPVPSVIHWEITGREKSGKSTLVAQLAKPGVVVVVDSDGRFGDGVPQESQSEFYPISDNKEDMIEIDKIISILSKARKTKADVSMIVIDTITNILEPIIQKIQDAKQYTNVYDYKPKSDAMKHLRHELSLWNCETVWIYHIVEYLEKEGKDYVTKEKKYLSDIEYGRLGKAITISLEVVVDTTGKRGVKVKEARDGRAGIIIWDESGQWKDFRKIIEERVWGGLTQQDQQTIEESLPTSFPDASSALRWGWNYSENNGQFFSDAAHAKNSLQKLSGELREQLGDEFSYDILWEAWVTKVVAKGNSNNVTE